MAVALSTENFIKNIKQNNPTLQVKADTYVNSRTNVEVKCKVCNHMWHTLANNISGRHPTGCPVCSLKNRTSRKRITAEEWWRRCSIKYENKYKCDLSKYIDQETPIPIECPIHGIFLKKPLQHMHYSGCNKCMYHNKGGRVSATTDTYVERVSVVHNNLYNYAKTQYTGSKHKVIVTCPEHGDFSITASHHLRGAGCQKCTNSNMARRRTNNVSDFIINARKIHHTLYDYSKAIYLGYKTKLTIICPKHGEFQQTPNNHIAGRGCPVCAASSKSVNATKTTDMFIADASVSHGDKYDYSKTKYINSREKVIITCPEHGDFLQRPDGHIAGNGCNKCIVHLNRSGKLTLNDVLTRIHNMYPNKYDTSAVVYINQTTPMKIMCHKHGAFEETLKRLSNGYGCPECYSAGANLKIDNKFIEDANKVHNNRYSYNDVKFVNNSRKVLITCHKHGNFEQRRDAHLAGHGCMLCGYDAQKVSQSEFIKRVTELHPELILDDKTVYTRADLNVTVKCKKHGYFNRIASELMRPAVAGRVTIDCPKCMVSAGELKLHKLLTKLGFVFISEYQFMGSKYRYDFYIPELKLLIEYDGAQHYKPVAFFGGDSGYTDLRQRDKNKDELAAQRAMFLIRIPYTKYNELEKYFLWSLAKHYKYRYNNRYYTNYTQLVNTEKLPMDATVGDYDKYKTINITIT